MTNEPWDDTPLISNKSAFQFTRVGDLPILNQQSVSGSDWNFLKMMSNND